MPGNDDLRPARLGAFREVLQRRELVTARRDSPSSKPREPDDDEHRALDMTACERRTLHGEAQEAVEVGSRDNPEARRLADEALTVLVAAFRPFAEELY